MSYRLNHCLRIGLTAFLCVAGFKTFAYLEKIPKASGDACFLKKYVSAKPLGMGVMKEELVFLPRNDKANFTVFEGLHDIKVENGTLHFKTTKEDVRLGWGNVEGKQKVNKVNSLFSGRPVVSLKVRQISGEESVWKLSNIWRDGEIIRQRKRRSQKASQGQTLKQGEWTVLRFRAGGLRLFNPDGLEFDVKAPVGAKFEIASLKEVREIRGGYARYEFIIPEGKIWKALANVSFANEGAFYKETLKNQLYINGHAVERSGAGVYGVAPVDILPYLKPGPNCVGLFLSSPHPAAPCCIFDARIIMASGETVDVKSTPEWSFSPELTEGWNDVGFDGSSWKKAGEAKYGLGASFQDALPAWTGLITLRNPDYYTMVYSDDKPVRMEVLLPVGLEKKTPFLEYTLSESDETGKCEVIREGTVRELVKNENNLRGILDFGLLKGGVYTVELVLKDQAGSVLENRPAEPFMVLRKLKLKEVTCDDYLQGLDVELETEIDFTDSACPLPHVEVSVNSGAPVAVDEFKVIDKNGLKYRELTSEKRDSYLSYRIEFKHPGDFYICEVEYPDDADRCVEVLISRPQTWSTIIGVGAETGGKFFKTGKFKKLYCLFTGAPGPCSIDVKNVQDGWTAAVKTAKIYHVKGDLVSAGAGRKRNFGIHTERDYWANSFFRTFNPELMMSSKKKIEFERLPYDQLYLIKLRALMKACDKYAQYLKFTGQNARITGCYQYHQGNTPYIPFYRGRCASSVIPCPRFVLTNMMNLNDINFYAGIEFSNNARIWSSFNQAQVANGKDAVWMIDSSGKQLYGTLGTIVPNWLHPKYCKVLRQLIHDLNNSFSGMRNYRGVSSLFGPAQRVNYYSPALGNRSLEPFSFSYDDLTFRLFEKEAKVNLGISKQDPKRFAKRATMVKNSPNLKNKFRNWYCGKFVNFVQDCVSTLTRKDKTLTFLALLSLEDAFYGEFQKSGKSFEEFLKDYAFDIKALGQVDNLVLFRWTSTWRHCSSPEDRHFQLSSQSPITWIPRENAGVIETFNRFPHRGILCRTSWNEGVKAAAGSKYGFQPDYRDHTLVFDWLPRNAATRSSPLPGGYSAREGVTQGIITGDPQFLLTGFVDVALNGGSEQVIREVTRVFTRIPKENFKIELDTGLETNLAIRSLSRNGQSWFYVANPGYWNIRGSLKVTAGGDVINLANDKPVAEAGEITLKVELKPFGLAAWRVESDELNILSIETEPISADELAFMTDGIIGRVRELLTDDIVRLAVTSKDRKMMRNILARAELLLRENRYAAAWSVLKNPRFWTLWKFYLEKAVKYAAKLPDGIAPAQRGAKAEIPELEGMIVEKVDMNKSMLNSPPWKNNAASTPFITIKKGEVAMNPTVFKILADKDNIYFGFVCADTDTSAVRAEAKSDEKVFSSADDALGVFFQPDPKKNVYYQFIANFKGVGYDQKNVNGINDNTFKSEKKVVCEKRPGYWSMIMSVPRKAVEAETLDSVRVNVYRVMRNKRLPASVWSFPGDKKCAGGSLHNRERFGRITFRKHP